MLTTMFAAVAIMFLAPLFLSLGIVGLHIVLGYEDK